MTTKTRTAQTAHGDVSYETVDCSSCGQETRKEDATGFVIGEIGNEIARSSEWSYIELNNDDFYAGWVCEFCRDDPARYPATLPDRAGVAFFLAALLVFCAFGLGIVMGAAL